MTYLETEHPGGALDQDDPGQQEQKGVGNKGIDGLSVQQQVAAQSFSQGVCLHGGSRPALTCTPCFIKGLQNLLNGSLFSFIHFLVHI